MRIAPGSLAGSAKLQVSGMQAGGLLDAAPSGGALAVRPGAVDASLDAETDGRSTVRAALDASSRELVLERGARRLELGPVRIVADVARDAQTLTVSLRGLELGDLLPRATGSLRAHADGTGPALELEVPALDLARLRERALLLAGDVDAVRTAAGIIRAGTLQSLTISSAGSTWAALADPRTLRAAAGLAGGELDFPELGLAVRDGGAPSCSPTAPCGAARCPAGSAAPRSATAPSPSTWCRRVGLQDLRAAIDADLADALAMARRRARPRRRRRPGRHRIAARPRRRDLRLRAPGPPAELPRRAHAHPRRRPLSRRAVPPRREFRGTALCPRLAARAGALGHRRALAGDRRVSRRRARRGPHGARSERRRRARPRRALPVARVARSPAPGPEGAHAA